jgi:hypothetical protein
MKRNLLLAILSFILIANACTAVTPTPPIQSDENEYQQWVTANVTPATKIITDEIRHMSDCQDINCICGAPLTGFDSLRTDALNREPPAIYDSFHADTRLLLEDWALARTLFARVCQSHSEGDYQNLRNQVMAVNQDRASSQQEWIKATQR